MRNKSTKIAIIVISIILVISIITGIIAYLFLGTDLFRSDKELFSKYAAQNIDIMKQLINSGTVNTYQNLENQNAYNSVTLINLEHSEGGEISNPINDLSLQITAERDVANEYLYADAQLLFQNEKYLEGELIRSEELVGIRFSDVIKEFLTIKDDENLKIVADSLGLELEELQAIIKIIQGSEEPINEIISKEEIKQVSDKYMNVLKNGIANATFSSIKKATVTVNTKTIQANAYMAHISKEQIRQIITEILNNVKSDEIILSKTRNFIEDEVLLQQIDDTIENLALNEDIPEVKITVYEQKGITVQTILQIGEERVTIENIQNANQVNVKVIYKDDIANEQTVEIAKNSLENSENYDVSIKFLKEEQESEIKMKHDFEKEVDKFNTDIRIEYIEGITTVGVEISNTIMSNVDNQIILDKTNNVILNDIEESLLSNRIEWLKEKVTNKVMERITKLQEKFDIENQQKQDDEEQLQIEINKFNAKFEFYTGDEVSAENVKILLNIVKNNLNSIEYITTEDNSNIGNNFEKPINIKLNIERDRQNVELIDSILGDVKEGKKYKVSINYKDDNGMIDYIMVEEKTKE